jgi:hypothetical protein
VNRKTLAKSLSALSVKEGDILLVKCKEIEMSNQIAEAIAQLRNQIKLPKCLIVVLGAGDTLEKIDPAVMRRMGWERSKNA